MKRQDKICAAFNRIIDEKRQEEKKDSKERYPWLDDADERKYMTDKEILDKIYKSKRFLFKQARKENELWKCYMNIKMSLV